jgi:hypothetical protein
MGHSRVEYACKECGHKQDPVTGSAFFWRVAATAAALGQKRIAC